MAGAGFKTFNTGDVLTASDVNTYLMQQTVMVFDDAAARTTALTGVVAEGMLSYLKDTNAVEVYDGSSWVASDDPNAIQNSIVDAKGDLISATADNTPARLAVGADNTVLTADSSTSTGLKWAAAAAGGGMTLINTGGTTLTGASVTVSSIPTTYVNLYVIVRNFLPATDAAEVRLRLNGDSTANRYRALDYVNPLNDNLTFNNDSIPLGRPQDNSVDYSLGFITIYDYANTTSWKMLTAGMVNVNQTTTTNLNHLQSFAYYNQTAAITSLEFYTNTGNFTSGTVYVYGVK